MASEITEKDKLDVYRALSEQLHTQYNQRRELEWKIHVSIWTLISAIGYLLVSQKIHVGWELIWLFVMVPLHFVWCIKIHTGVFRDQHLSTLYRRAAEKLLKPGPIIDDEAGGALRPPRSLRRFFEGYGWWLVAEVGTTLLLTAAVVYIAWNWTSPPAEFSLF